MTISIKSWLEIVKEKHHLSKGYPIHTFAVNTYFNAENYYYPSRNTPNKDIKKSLIYHNFFFYFPYLIAWGFSRKKKEVYKTKLYFPEFKDMLHIHCWNKHYFLYL